VLKIKQPHSAAANVLSKMKVWWDENEEAPDQVEEGPGDR
jgi:hypothetical protein